MKINEIMDPKKSTYFLNNSLQSEMEKVKTEHFFVPVHWKKTTNQNKNPEIPTSNQKCFVYNLFCIWLHQS